MLAKQKRAEMPKEIRKEFNNDINDFMQNGYDWMQKQKEKIDAERNRQAEEMQKAIITAGATNE